MRTLIKIASGLTIATIGLAAPAHADTTQDENFYRLLAHDGVVSNFPLVRSQGIAACQREDAGETFR